MAYVRRRNVNRRKRRNYRKRMPYKMRMANKVKMVRSANLIKDVHYLSRHTVATETSLLSTNLSNVSATLDFKLNDVPNPTEFTNLFENYRIIGVKLRFRLMDNPDSNNYINSTLFTQGSNFYPQLWWCKDMDDASVLSLQQIRERGSSKCAVLYPNRYITVFIKYPKPLDEVYETAGSTTFAAAPKGMWLRSSAPAVVHLGLKVCVDKMGYAGNTCTVGIERQYFFAFKNSK